MLHPSLWMEFTVVEFFFLIFGISCFRKVHVPAIVVDFLK